MFSLFIIAYFFNFTNIYCNTSFTITILFLKLAMVDIELECSTIWVARQSRRFLCLFWRETRQRILGPEISLYPEVVRGREWELATRGVGDERAERRDRKESWRGTTDRGSQHRTPETVADKIGSSEEDWVKRCQHSSACGIFASNPRQR